LEHSGTRGTPKGGQNLPANTGSIVPYHALPAFPWRARIPASPRTAPNVKANSRFCDMT
jgi:hypothetical protein